MNDVKSNSNKILLRERSIPIGSNNAKKFSAYIKEMRKTIIGPSGKNGITTRELAKILNINYEQFRKILNNNKPTKKRDCIIAICAVLGLDSEETNTALGLYNYMPRLDKDNDRDDELITILEEQFENKLSIDEINTRLARNGFPELDIIDHKSSSRPQSEKKDSPYKLIKKQARTLTDNILYGDQYDSMKNEYSINKYQCYADMWLKDKKRNKYLILTADTDHQYNLLIQYKDGYESKSFSAIEESGEFMDYYLELEALAKREKKNNLSILNDTKNYQTRVGAGIYEDSLHIYAETYNYSIPEINEYYLFEYVNGSMVLSVFPKSMFMRCYLTKYEYESVYGEEPIVPSIKYDSLEDIELDNSEKDYTEKSLSHYRSRYFQKLKQQADELICDLKEKKRFIRHLDYYYDDQDRVCEFFGVIKEFKCFDVDEYGLIMAAGIDNADFHFDDCGTVNISLQDLYDSFELGFNNMNEICRVKKKHGSIRAILNCL